jgi:hypothetical protein
MNQELNTENIGQELGLEGVGSVVAKVEEYCAHEEMRIALVNQPKILACQAEIAMLQDEGRNLEERLRHAPPPGDVQSRRRRVAYYWIVTGVLAVSAFVFSLLAFDPFRLGWKSWLHCLGISIVTPFLIEEVIERWNKERLVTMLATFAFAGALLSLVLLAVIRGDLLAETFGTTQSSVVIDDTQSTPPPETNFYARTLPLLRLVMALFAFAMELGAWARTP